MIMTRRFIEPGEFYVGNKPAIYETLVGSCVCVCLYNFKNGYAAMNHFLRDRPTGNSPVETGEFGSTSTQHIIGRLMTIDDLPAHYRAMVFGGAAVIKTTSRDSDVGRSNVDVALRVLADAHIRVVMKEVFGKRGRRVTFNTEAGTAKWRFAGDVGKRSRG